MPIPKGTRAVTCLDEKSPRPHWVAATEDGIRVTDVWESAEQFERFAAESIGPVTQEVGVDGLPEITVHPVHIYLTAG